MNALDNGFIVARAISITFSTLVRKSRDSQSTRYIRQLNAQSTILSTHHRYQIDPSHHIIHLDIND